MMAALGKPEVPLVLTYAAVVLSGSSTCTQSFSPHTRNWLSMEAKDKDIGSTDTTFLSGLGSDF
jgi:hypothetical protein